jgi:UDP-N-acetyl-D-galactosamine dehydrogenase
MGIHVANRVIKGMIKKNLAITNAKVLILGITFKENCPDIRNSRVIDVIHELKAFGCQIDVYDPHAISHEVQHEYGLETVTSACLKNLSQYSGIILAVAHQEFKDISWDQVQRDKQVVFDVKGALPRGIVDGRL